MKELPLRDLDPVNIYINKFMHHLRYKGIRLEITPNKLERFASHFCQRHRIHLGYFYTELMRRGIFYPMGDGYLKINRDAIPRYYNKKSKKISE